MTATLAEQYVASLPGGGAVEPSAVDIVAAVMSSASDARASDIHLVPDADGLSMYWRLDGVLHSVTRFDAGISRNIIARLKVLAGLLTYRSEVPQEGRLKPEDEAVEMRLSTFPTLHGEKAVVRLFVGSGSYRRLDDLGLPDDIRTGLGDLLLEAGGVIALCGPAGSGKTTTAYACLREIVHLSYGQRSLVTLEDPIEAAVSGVTQSQINDVAGFDYHTGLKSLLRQDPEVILVGEIRDRLTAETVFQAGLSGHLVVTTYHAGSAVEALCRLLDMGIEPYLLRTGIQSVLAQRLVRSLCDCAIPDEALLDDPQFHNSEQTDTPTFRRPTGCPGCRGTGYSGRLLLAEFLRLDDEALGQAVLSRADASVLQRLAAQAGMVTRWERAVSAVRRGMTSAAELRRVFGIRHS